MTSHPRTRATVNVRVAGAARAHPEPMPRRVGAYFAAVLNLKRNDAGDEARNDGGD